jgi:hypothetical protein
LLISGRSSELGDIFSPGPTARDSARVAPEEQVVPSDLVDRVWAFASPGDPPAHGLRSFTAEIAGDEATPIPSEGQLKLRRALAKVRREAPAPKTEPATIPGLKKTVCAQKFADFLRQTQDPLPSFLRRSE